MKLFVYGTLKSGCCNHHILTNVIGNQKPIYGISTERYPMYKGAQYFPYLEDQIGYGNNIKGEVYEINEKHLPHLDYFEGVPNLYKRGYIDISTDNEIVKCFCYFRAKETDVPFDDLISEWIE